LRRANDSDPPSTVSAVGAAGTDKPGTAIAEVTGGPSHQGLDEPPFGARGNPHPAARSENDWKVAPSSTERNCSSSGSLKHAFEPSLFEPKSPLPGNGIFKPETNGPKRRRSSRHGARETKPTRRTHADLGLIAGFREISVRTRMRGGAERTRTACQARSRYRTGLSRVIQRGNSAMKCRRSRATTLSRKDWHSGAIGAVLSVNFGRQGRPEILPRRLHRRGGASVVRRDAAKPNGGSRCQSLQRSDRRRQRQPPFQRRDTARTILSRRGSIAARSNRASSACCNHPQAQRFGDGRNSTLTSIENQ
jgi:hypothetical protein